MNIDIGSDNKDVEKMVLAAKSNNWEKVYKVLDDKPYLINCIPEGRAWAALHQAVYWNKSAIVTNLLDYRTCDAIVKSKQCRDEMIKPSSTPSELADLKGYVDIKHLLNTNITDHRRGRFGDEIPRFVIRAEGEEISKIGFPLFVLGVVMYKNSVLDPNEKVQSHSVKLMKKIFDNEEQQWPLIEEKLYQALYGHCKASADFIRKAHATNEATFFQELIGLYTSNHVYKEVNVALGREFQRSYTPTAEDLSLGLYALLLDITLTFWTDLKKVEKTTYRGVNTNVTIQYVPGQEIMFTTMLSSSITKSVASGFQGNSGTMFIFDNSNASTSSKHPREIWKYSQFPSEKECLYTLGTSFKVQEVDKKSRTVKLLLL